MGGKKDVDNNETICERKTPRLSSIASDFERSGLLAVRILNALFHCPEMKPTSRTFSPLMVVRRETTRARSEIGGEVAEMRFRAARGHSILEEIQSVRMEHANDLLSHGNMTVKAVANFCGYASESTFHRLYRKTFGHAPRHLPQASLK